MAEAQSCRWGQGRPRSREMSRLDEVRLASPAIAKDRRMLALSVLGEVEVRNDGRLVRVPAGKATELLVRLALDAGTVVRSERIIEDLWDTVAVDTDRNTLQSKVSMLRRSLDDATLVRATSGGYLLDVPRECIDGLAAADLGGRAHTLLAAGDAAAALAESEEGLALFRGEILSGAGAGDWLVPHRAHLEEVRLGLVQARIDARMALGAGSEVVAELELLVAQHPLREGLWRQLITALYRDGRQADALAAYQRVRALLDDELGLTPGEDLRILEQQVLRHDPALEAPPTTPPASTSAADVGNLPGLSSRLVGREHDLAAVHDATLSHRLVTLVGPAGVGKTRLAIEAARQHKAEDGSWLVRLESATDDASLPHVLGEALGLTGPTEATVVDRLRSSEALIVLDNCEHLVDEVARLCLDLLGSCMSLRLLATSQLPLGLEGESVLELEPLSLGDSVTLFELRASERRGGVAYDAAAAEAVQEVCRALDGLPLAIELAAARTKALSVQEIARRLDDRFSLLSDPGGRRADRHRALGTAVAWSYDLLFPDDQRGLWALAAFSGGAPLAAAESVAAALGVPHASAVDVLARLAERSLVVVEIDGAGAVRYRLLDSVRAFALARLEESGLLATAQAAHAEWFAVAADRARAEERGPRQSDHQMVTRTERANIDLALDWAVGNDPLLGVRIATGFGWTWVILGDAASAGRLRRAEAAARGLTSDEQRAVLLGLAGWSEAGADVQQSLALGRESLELAQSSGDVAAVAEARRALGFALLRSADPHRLIELLEPELTDDRAASQWDPGCAAILVGYAACALGDTARVHAACEVGARAVTATGDNWLAGHVEAIFGQLAQAEHRYEDAAVHLRRAAESAHRAELAATEGFHLAGLGRALQLAGDPQSAIAALDRAIELTQQVGLMRAVALSRVRLGRLLRSVGDDRAARAALVQADDWFRASGGGDESALAECLVGAIDAEFDQPGSTGALEALLKREPDDIEVQVLALDALAAVQARAGEHDAALALLARADAVMPTASHLISEDDRIDARRARAVLAAGSGPS
jgi:predicted ATPase/DNA-binding SARP family transcriptional activator